MCEKSIRSLFITSKEIQSISTEIQTNEKRRINLSVGTKAVVLNDISTVKTKSTAVK